MFNAAAMRVALTALRSIDQWPTMAIKMAFKNKMRTHLLSRKIVILILSLMLLERLKSAIFCCCNEIIAINELVHINATENIVNAYETHTHTRQIVKIY